ncbi:hypothetical protein NECAME_13412 [Necator americanus]|uniref:Uncharacterized protein n=1 Tax=Necator americanus TaxID=51031 RepID=W2SYT2_NECAM|nr:hypothetical protein NECAME_13412 [Necator americanus]ETN73792.1 hypothetical protein NECAME_13412 [Necator americanus]
MFFVAAYATIRRNKFLLRAYCAVIAMMVIVQLVSGLLAFTYSDQINQLASDDILYESLNKTASRYASPPPSDGETQFWIHTQNTLLNENANNINGKADHCAHPALTWRHTWEGF